ncbi:MAG: glycosyltransferase family 61 protein [Alphaproteobacteria bacterium]|nr:glycosyltransferase family 61 protein [Alphaproteobacteria bacterium]
MILTEVRGEPASIVTSGLLVVGSGMAFSQDLTQAYIPTAFDPDLDITQEEVIRTLVRVSEGDETRFRFRHPPEVVAHLMRDAVPLNLLHPANYFHFLVEALPSLLSLIAQDALGRNAMLVSGLLHPNMWQALRYATQRTPLPITQLQPFQAVTSDRVILPTPSWHATELRAGGVSKSAFDAGNIALLRKAFQPLWADVPAPQRIKVFIRRPAAHRALSNAPEIEALAVAAGYRIVDPGRMPLLDQIRTFSAASHIAGPTGAWAANLVFANDAKVTVLYPQTCAVEGENLWGALGRICGLDMREAYGPVTRLLPQMPLHSDFMIPPEVFTAQLAA